MLGDNLQLIDNCMSFNLITEQEATFYYLHIPEQTLRNILGSQQPKKASNFNLDEII